MLAYKHLIEMAQEITAALITEQLKRKVYELRSVTSRSQVWKTFGVVHDENGDRLDFAACQVSISNYNDYHI